MGKPRYHNTSLAFGKITKLAGLPWKLRPLTLQEARSRAETQATTTVCE